MQPSALFRAAHRRGERNLEVDRGDGGGLGVFSKPVWNVVHIATLVRANKKNATAAVVPTMTKTQ